MILNIILFSILIFTFYYIFLVLKEKFNTTQVSIDCEEYDSNNCDLKRCIFSREQNKCMVPLNISFEKDSDNISFKENILFSNIDVNTKENIAIFGLTPYIDNIIFYKFKKGDTKLENSYIYISDFYSKTLNFSFIFYMNQLRKKTPIITTQNWQISISYNNLIVNINGTETIIERNINGKTQGTGVNNIFFLGVLQDKSELKIVFYNYGDKDINLNNYTYNYTIDEESQNIPFILVGTDLIRENYFSGFFADLFVSRNLITELELKRKSYVFSDKEIEISSLGYRDNNNFLVVSEEGLPSKISFFTQIEGKIVNLFWFPPEKGGRIVTYYIIIVKNMDTGTSFFEIISSKNCIKCSYSLKNLDTNVNYQIGITSLNLNGLCFDLDFVNVLLIDSTTPSIKQNDDNENGIVKKIFCNPDGTFTQGNNCDDMGMVRISSTLSDEDYNLLKDKLTTKKMYDINFDLNLD